MNVKLRLQIVPSCASILKGVSTVLVIIPGMKLYRETRLVKVCKPINKYNFKLFQWITTSA